VSVVATGIDQAILSQAESAPVSIRTEAAPRSRPAPTPVRAPAALNVVEMAQTAPYINDVEIQPVAPLAASFPEPIEAQPDYLEEDPNFIPPAPEPVVRAARMPQIEDLPQVAQQQLRAMREAQQVQSAAPSQAATAPETRRRSLLEKLAAFGIATRHEEELPPAQRAPSPLPPPAAAPLPAPRLHPALSTQPELARPHPRAQQVRSAAGGLDAHGRPSPRLPVTEDDQLDIPAFLRRQPN
jgi:cell division protein FtsZ